MIKVIITDNNINQNSIFVDYLTNDEKCKIASDDPDKKILIAKMIKFLQKKLKNYC